MYFIPRFVCEFVSLLSVARASEQQAVAKDGTKRVDVIANGRGGSHEGCGGSDEALIDKKAGFPGFVTADSYKAD
jgi:hypothetical protein